MSVFLLNQFAETIGDRLWFVHMLGLGATRSVFRFARGAIGLNVFVCDCMLFFHFWKLRPARNDLDDIGGAPRITTKHTSDQAYYAACRCCMSYMQTPTPHAHTRTPRIRDLAMPAPFTACAA